MSSSTSRGNAEEEEGKMDDSASPSKAKEPLRETCTVLDKRPSSCFRCAMALKLPFSSMTTVPNPISCDKSFELLISHLPVCGGVGVYVSVSV